MKRTTLVLSDSDYTQLHSFIKTGKKSGKELERAYILMALHKQKSYKDVEEYYYVNRTTIWRTACNYREHGLNYALTDNVRTGQPRKYSDKQEAEVIALACSESPQGRKRWTIRLLTEQLQKKYEYENYKQRKRSLNTKKNKFKPWLKKMWCIGKLTREYRQRMYRILDLYNKPLDAKMPVVCMDEKSKQLIDDVRQPLAMKAKKVKRIDSEYKRNGTRNIFVAVEPKAGVHVVHVTKTRTKKDFAHFIRYLLTGVYKGIGKICLVLDNLNTHFAKSFYETFPQKEATALLARIEFYYTPKHGSWLNMEEIEIGILDEECIGCRIGNETKLKNTVKLWVEQRNKDKKKINWQFTKRNAYNKLSGHYVS